MIRSEIAASMLVGAAVLLATTPGRAQTTPEAPVAPTLRVEQKTVDVGDVVVGREKTAVYVFHNDGEADVHILRAKPS